MEARLRNKGLRVPVATPLPSQLFWNVPCRRGNTQTSLSKCLQGLPPYRVLFRTRPLTLMGLALIFSLCRFSPVFLSVSLLGTCHCAPVAFSTPGPEGSTFRFHMALRSPGTNDCSKCLEQNQKAFPLQKRKGTLR